MPEVVARGRAFDVLADLLPRDLNAVFDEREDADVARVRAGAAVRPRPYGNVEAVAAQRRRSRLVARGLAVDVLADLLLRVVDEREDADVPRVLAGLVVRSRPYRHDVAGRAQ